MEERDFIGETDFSSSCVDSDGSPDIFRPTTRQGHRSSHSTAVRRLSFSTSGRQPSGSCNVLQTLPQLGHDRSLGSASTSSASHATLSPSPLPSRAALESSSDVLQKILSEVQNTSKEVDKIKACVNDLDKRMAAVEQRETERSSGSCSSAERTPTFVPNKVRVS